MGHTVRTMPRSLSAEQCSLYAQVIPVFLIAVIAVMRIWKPSPLATLSTHLLFPAVVVLGSAAEVVALVDSAAGAGPVAAPFIILATTWCISITAMLAIAEPFSPWLYDRAIRRREEELRKEQAKLRRAQDELSGSGSGSSAQSGTEEEHPTL
jgi:hypothetical protein